MLSLDSKGTNSSSTIKCQFNRSATCQRHEDHHPTLLECQDAPSQHDTPSTRSPPHHPSTTTTLQQDTPIDMDHDTTSSLVFCMDLTFLSHEPIRYLEARILDAHRRLLDLGQEIQSDNDGAVSERYSIVNPKLSYRPIPKRTGSFVMANGSSHQEASKGSVGNSHNDVTKPWKRVDTASTVDTSFSSSNHSRWHRTEGHACLVDLEVPEEVKSDLFSSHQDETVVVSVDTNVQQDVLEQDLSSHTAARDDVSELGSGIFSIVESGELCSWGHFVDSLTPYSSPAVPQLRKTPSYRHFMNKELQNNNFAGTDLELMVE